MTTDPLRPPAMRPDDTAGFGTPSGSRASEPRDEPVADTEAATTAGAATTGRPAPRMVTTLPFRLATFAAIGAALVWSVTAMLCASRGLDITDESFYLLSYRWWDDNFDNFTGAQYFYGPIFELLGYDIAGLRVFKLVTLLLAHGVFGWQFMRWLRLHRPDAPTTRWWEAAGTATIIASSGIVYSWLPLSPGYNDLALTCAVLAAGTALRTVRALTIGAKPPWWAPGGLGAVAVVMILDKWSSSLVTLAVIGAALLAVVVAHRSGWRVLLGLTGFIAAGALLMLAVINFLLVPLGTLIPPLLEVNSLVADSSNSPTSLLERYWDGAAELAHDIVRQQGLLLVAAIAVVLARRRWAALGVVVLSMAVAAVQVVRYDGLIAGPIQLPAFTVTIFAPLVAVALAGTASAVRDRGRPRRERHPGGPTKTDRYAVFVMLIALPVAQAAGTGNPIHFLAITGLGVWVAAAIAILTGLHPDAFGPRALVAGMLSGLVVATSLIAVDGLWNRPYRTTGHDASTTTAAGVPALSSVRFDRRTAHTYSDLHALLDRYVEPKGRAMMGFDGLAGVVLMLDGRPVGEPWYSAKFPMRAAAGIRRACADGDPWWGDRKPLVLFNRPDTRLERRALRACDLSLREDYRRLTFTGVRGGTLEIYVPVDE